VRKDDFAHLDEIYHRWSPTWDYPPEELAPLKACFAEPGVVEAALGYYRDFVRGALGKAGKDARRLVNRRCSVPSLAIGGSDDPTVSEADFARAEKAYTADYRYVMMPGGHFVHREAPDAFVKETVSFLTA
ncbi:MAG: alpha/beta hydrolase, partial [Phycisphaerales bacterium]|nr:alpha/beta hydrolase [Phycisphaerales bacterium]